MTKSSDNFDAILKAVAKQHGMASEKWDDDYELRQAEVRQLFELLASKPKYTLEELLAQCTPENRHAEIETLYGHRRHTTEFSSGEDLAAKAKASFRARNSPINVKIKRLADDIPTPSYAHAGDSGFDFVAAEDIIIEPGETVKVRTGLAFEIPPGYELQIRPRSGITSKTKLRVQLGTIDSGFRGEVSVIVDNISRDDWSNAARLLDNSYADETRNKVRSGAYLIRKNDRIGQAVIAPVVQAQFEVVDELGESERGAGGFGSSGVKALKENVAKASAVIDEALRRIDEAKEAE